jgi:hypothetical protein
VAKTDDALSNSDKKNPPDEASPLDEAMFGEEALIEGEATIEEQPATPVEELETVEEPAAEKAEPAKKGKKEKKAKKEKKPKEAKKETDAFWEEKKARDPSFYLAMGLVIGIPVVLLAAAQFKYLNFSTAIYIVGLCSIPLVLWMGRRTNTIYVVFMGIILAALITCIYAMWVVLAKYNFDVKAQEAKQRVAMVQPVDHGGNSVGWPSAMLPRFA